MNIQNGVLISVSHSDIKNGTVKIPSNVTSIGNYAFRNCTGLAELKLPESLTSIGYCAFRNCTGLTELKLPESLTSIGYCAFYNCTGLTELKLPESLTSIGNYAFQNCTGLAELKLPESLTSIGDGAFYNCTGLTELKLPESLTSIGYCAFQNCTGLAEVKHKRFKREDTYKVKCVDGMLVHILNHRNFSETIEIYKAQYISGMRDKKLILQNCYIAEQDGTFAHGETLKTAVSDLNFKFAAERGRDQYRHIGIDDAVEFEEAIAMYRIITGACQFGTEQFIKTIEKPQETYTPREIIRMTGSQYGHQAFADFWGM